MFRLSCLGIAAWCWLQVSAEAIGADEPDPPIMTRPAAVMERPKGGDPKLPVSWRSLAITPNGKTLIATGTLPGRTNYSGTSVMAIWQAESGKLKADASMWAAGDLTLSTDGKTAIARVDRSRPVPAGTGTKSRLGGFTAGDPQMPLSMGFQHHFLQWTLSENQPSKLVLEIGKGVPGKGRVGDQLSIFGLQFLPNRKFALGTSNGFLIWDYKPNKMPGSTAVDTTFTLPASKAALDPNQFDRKLKSSLGIAADGSLWIVHLAGGEVEGWDLRKSRARFQFPVAGSEPVVAVPADGTVFAFGVPRGAGQPVEVDIRHGTDGEVTTRLPGGPTGTLVSLAISADGSVLAAGGDDGTITVWNVADGAVIGRITGLTELVWPLAMSQKGTVLASADKTGIQVWDLDRLRKTGKSVGPAEPSAPSPDINEPGHGEGADQPAEEGDVLARGPVSVTLKIGGKSETRELLGLTRQKLVIRKPGELRFQVETAATGKVEEISTSDKKFSWKLDAQKKLFVGPVYAGRAPPLPEDRQPTLSPAQLQTYLYLGWRRLMNRISDVAQDPINSAELGDLGALAEVRGRFAREQHLNGRLVELYSGLADYITTLQRETAKQQKVIEEYTEQQSRLAADREKVRQEAAPWKKLGLLQMFIGAIPTTTTVSDAFGNLYIVNTGIVSPELFEQGLSTMLNASLDEAHREIALRAAEGIIDARMRDRIKQSVATLQNASDSLLKKYQSLADEPYAIHDLVEIKAEELKPPEKSAPSDIYRPLLERLEQRAEQERAVLGQDNPFTLAELEYLRGMASTVSSAGDLGTRISRLRERSDRIATLAGLVPADAAFDADRAEMFARAGTVALRAAVEQVGPQHWVDAFNEHADVARALFEKALSLAPHDHAGRWREQLAWSLVLSGRAAAGVKLAISVAPQRNRSSRFLYQLARTKCSIGMLDEGFNDLEDALTRLGFEDVIEAQNASDFPKADIRFKDLLKLEVELQKFKGNQPADEFHVINRSRFTLRNARVRVTFNGTDLKGKPGNRDAEKTVAEWHPGEEVIVKIKADNRVVMPGRRFGAREAPQPKAKVVVTSPRQGSGSDKLE